jgi:hypothetical protein
MGGGAGCEFNFSLHRPFDFDNWYFILFGDRVRQHGDIPAMEKIK